MKSLIYIISTFMLLINTISCQEQPKNKGNKRRERKSVTELFGRASESKFDKEQKEVVEAIDSATADPNNPRAINRVAKESDDVVSVIKKMDPDEVADPEKRHMISVLQSLYRDMDSNDIGKARKDTTEAFNMIVKSQMEKLDMLVEKTTDPKKKAQLQLLKSKIQNLMPTISTQEQSAETIIEIVRRAIDILNQAKLAGDIPHEKIRDRLQVLVKTMKVMNDRGGNPRVSKLIGAVTRAILDASKSDSPDALKEAADRIRQAMAEMRESEED